MKKLEQLYEGKAKKVFATDDPNVVLVDYKDDATAFNGLKKGTIMGKGVINNRVTNFLMKMLEKNGIPTHYIEEISDRETLVKKVHIVPLEVIVRNIAAKFTDAENLWDGEVHPLDLIDCNGRQCLTIACSGIDARVAESVHELGDSPLLSGRGSYLAAVAVNFLFRGIGQHWRVTLDDEVIEDDFALVSMCNGRYYGGGSTPVPEARMDDGVLHTVLVKNISRMKFAGLFSAYSAGRYRSLPPEVIRVVTAKNVRIQSEDDIVTCLDGETIHSRDVRLTLSEKRLNFFGPKGCDPNYGAGPK